MHILFIDNVHPSLKRNLELKGYLCKQGDHLSKEEVEKIIHKYEGIVIRSRLKIDQQIIDKAKKLKFIARAGSGLENIDTKYAKYKNINCFNAGNGNSQAVAEHALAMILSLLNNLNKADKEIRKGLWKREENRGIELSGKTIAVIGYGNIGSSFANIITSFGVKILAYDKYLMKYNYQSSMEEIYEQADILSLHIPLTKETRYLINNDFINKFKKEIYLINTSRGECINTKELVLNLKEGKIKGVCLDVLENESSCFEKLIKTKNSPEIEYLLRSEKSILSPHVAGWSKQSNSKISNILFEKILSL